MIREELLAELSSALADVIRTNRAAMSAERDKDWTALGVCRVARSDAMDKYNALILECTDEEHAEERRRAMHTELQKHVA